MIFRFRTKEEAEDCLKHVRKGGSASPAIIREAMEYSRLKERYPFRGWRS